jgi:hypothetical protein
MAGVETISGQRQREYRGLDVEKWSAHGEAFHPQPGPLTNLEELPFLDVVALPNTSMIGVAAETRWAMFSGRGCGSDGAELTSPPPASTLT